MGADGDWEKQLQDLTYIMEGSGDQGYLTCSHITCADLAWFGQFYRHLHNDQLIVKEKGHVIDTAKQTLQKYPKMVAWDAKMKAACEDFIPKLLKIHY